MTLFNYSIDITHLIEWPPKQEYWYLWMYLYYSDIHQYQYSCFGGHSIKWVIIIKVHTSCEHDIFENFDPFFWLYHSKILK